MADALKSASGVASDVAADIESAGAALAEAAKGPSQPVAQSKWYRWRKDGTALIAYLLDSEVHTFAFSVAANAILSFIPFVMLLYTLALRVFHSQSMVDVVDSMVNYFLPSVTRTPNWLANSIEAVAALSTRHGVQALSLVVILISCTGIFLPLEVALNQAWGVKKSRNYLFNQAIAFGLALLMVGLAVASMVANVAVDEALPVAFFHHTDNIVFKFVSGSQLHLAGDYHGRGVDSVLLLRVLHPAEPPGTVAAGTAHLRLHRNRVAHLALHLCSRTSAPRSAVPLWPLLCLGRAALLGVYFGADSVRRGAVQRGATGRREEVRWPAQKDDGEMERKRGSPGFPTIF